VLQQYKDVLESDISEFFDFTPFGMTLKDLRFLPVRKRRLIQSVKRTQWGWELKLESKGKARAEIARQLGLFHESHFKEQNRKKSYVIRIEYINPDGKTVIPEPYEDVGMPKLPEDNRMKQLDESGEPSREMTIPESDEEFEVDPEFMDAEDDRFNFH
jgi:hypothetical protein